jgi:hypothetical protein
MTAAIAAAPVFFKRFFIMMVLPLLSCQYVLFDNLEFAWLQDEVKAVRASESTLGFPPCDRNIYGKR